MNIRRILLALIISMLVSTGVSASSQEITITVNGVQLQTDAPARIVNNRTLAPVRAIFEAMDAKVEWVDSTRTVIGTKGNDKVILQIGNTTASVNGKSIILDSPPIIVNNSTLAPVRFIAESLGATVEWDEKTSTVIINNTYDNATIIESEVLRLVNIERSKVGLPTLRKSNELSKVARIKSQDMADNNYFDHYSPTYGSPFDMMNQFGIRFYSAAENISTGYSTAESVMNGWMNSSGHKANILSSNFGTLGVGYVNKNGTTYWTQMFTN